MGSTLDYLMDHAAGGSVSFHMPGHKGSAFFERHGYGEFLRRIADCDITEIPGADNLFHADGILRDTAEKYAQIYGVKRSFLLVNGTSCGLIAGILASVPRGGKLIMARNSHKSVYNALRLGDIKPLYVYPSVVEGLGISGPVAASDIAAALEGNPDASAVILPNPDYYGVCSDLAAIAKIVHEHGKVLIADQAHGAHLKMMEGCGDLPLSAETAGADIVVGSTHKTLGSFTQSAVLNLCSDRVEESDLEDKLQMIESSSPSYILMASLDIAATIIEEKGEEIFPQWLRSLDRFYDDIQKVPGISAVQRPFLDRTKILLDSGKLGLTGAQMERKLMEHGIYPELTSGTLVMCMTGIGTTAEHLDALGDAVKKIAELGPYGEKKTDAPDERIWQKRRDGFALDGGAETVRLSDAAGMLCAENIIPYPPGIPLICRGEKIDEEDISYLKRLLDEGHDVLGIRDGDLIKAAASS